MLTPRMAELLSYIECRIATTGGVPPTYDEMHRALGVGKSSISRLVKTLAERGYIRRLPHKAQAIEVLRSARPSQPPVVRVSSGQQIKIAAFRFDDATKVFVKSHILDTSSGTFVPFHPGQNGKSPEGCDPSGLL